MSACKNGSLESLTKFHFPFDQTQEFKSTQNLFSVTMLEAERATQGNKTFHLSEYLHNDVKHLTSSHIYLTSLYTAALHIDQ